MDRFGKVFSLGVLLLYVLAAAAGLFFIAKEYNGGVVPASRGRAVGDYQAAILAAYSRADEKLHYLDAAAEEALDDALFLLRRDQYGFFTRDLGDATIGLPCGVYAYQLWNDGARDGWCLPGERVILEETARHTLLGVGAAAASYPGGAVAPAYSASAELADGRLRATLTGRDALTEPILFNLGSAGSAPSGRAPSAAAPQPSHVARQFATGGDDRIGTAAAAQTLAWPSTGSDRINSCFGPRILSYAAGPEHHGIDIDPDGAVIAAADGVVINDPAASGCGVVWIQHSPELTTRYIHMEWIAVAHGETVRRGQVIGHPGEACAEGRPHLHFEVRVPSVPGSMAHAYQSDYTPGWYAVNPVCFFSDATLAGVMVSPDAINSCYADGAPADPLSGYCDEYGFTVDPARTYSAETGVARPGEVGSPEPTETPAAPDPVVLPTGVSLTFEQQGKFDTTVRNRYEFGWDEHVRRAAAETGVDQALLLGVITQESLGDPLAVSSTGCAGVAQWCIDNAEKERSTAASFFGGAYLTYCRCGGPRATPGSGCDCTPENDRRLLPAYAIPAEAGLLRALLDTFAQHRDQLAFAIASYNAGDPVIRRAINGVGDDDPSWEEVAAHLIRNPEVITYFSDPDQQEQKAREIVDYVEQVTAFIAAWNGGAPLDEGRAGPFGSVSSFGAYRFMPSVAAETADGVSPFLALATSVEETLRRCADAEEPGACLETAAADSGLTACEPFLGLYAAIRDCAENRQYDCRCDLPAPGDGTFSIDVAEGHARADGGDARYVGLPSLLVDGAPAETITISPDGLAWMDAAGEHGPREVWELVKNGDALSFVASSSLPSCAPVKRMYAFCAPDTTRFAVTLIDDEAPPPVTGLAYDEATGVVTFTPSASPDLSFHNVYDETPRPGLVPALQLRGATSFDASRFAGRTLFVTAVDKAGNEGAAARVTIASG